MTIEPLLLTSARVATFDGDLVLTAATGFFFERDGQLWLVTARHVLIDEPSGHRPNRIEIQFHTDPDNLTKMSVLSLWIYEGGNGIWRQGSDSAGEIDVAVIQLDAASLPKRRELRAFTPEHLQSDLKAAEVGDALLIVGFPLGFQDTVHYLPVVRQATIASSFGVRFQGQGYFLTDARLHRGSSGAPVVMRDPAGDSALPWKLLGVHSSRLDMKTRDLDQDESLGLNCAWYADILLTLTAPKPPTQAKAKA